MRELETKRLRLRPLTADDHDALYAIYADPDVSRTLITRPQSPQEFATPFAQMLANASTLGLWAIVDKTSNAFIGRCGYYWFLESAARTPELAYLLARPYWGMGLATEAARRCVEYAFAEQEWAEVVAMVRVGNAASVRVLSKLGMEFLRRIEVRGIAAELYRLERP